MRDNSDNSTEDLFNTLKEVSSERHLDTYINSIEDKYPMDFGSFMEDIFAKKRITPSDVVKKSHIDHSYFYKLLSGVKNPGRDKVIAVALASDMDLKETQRLLEITNNGILYSKSTRDSILIYAINKKLSIPALNSLLEQYGQPPIK